MISDDFNSRREKTERIENESNENENKANWIEKRELSDQFVFAVENNLEMTELQFSIGLCWLSMFELKIPIEFLVNRKFHWSSMENDSLGEFVGQIDLKGNEWMMEKSKEKEIETNNPIEYWPNVTTIVFKGFLMFVSLEQINNIEISIEERNERVFQILFIGMLVFL